MKKTDSIEIAEGIYWVGARHKNAGLQCNPYLVVDGNEAVLIDPGSVLDCEYVYSNICSIVDPKTIRHIIVHHQDPDLCSSLPILEKVDFNFKIVTHWRTSLLVKYYGIKSDFYIVNENKFQLTLESGRIFYFFPAPYLHFPGAIMTYDQKTQTLFSGDVFGAFSDADSLYAQDDYIEKMKTFHEHYMPSNQILRPVMENLLKTPITIIAPQHGSIIDKNILEHIKILRDLECGALLRPVKKKLIESGGYKAVCEIVLKRCAGLYGIEEITSIFDGTAIILNLDATIKETILPGYELWDLIFERIFTAKGIQWLIALEPLTKMLSIEYNIPLPQSISGNLLYAEMETMKLSEENKILLETKDELERGLVQVQEKIIRSSVTGFYNSDFFKKYLFEEVRRLCELKSEKSSTLVLISLDQIENIKYKYGDAAVDDIFRITASLLSEMREDYQTYFKLQGSLFACVLPYVSSERAYTIAEQVRNTISLSKKYVQQITASIGVVNFGELQSSECAPNQLAERFYETANARVRLARNKGGNIVCNTSLEEDRIEKGSYVLLADFDEIEKEILKTFLERQSYSVLTAADGAEAQRLAEQYLPAMIISETMLPKADGFLLRQALLLRSDTKNIPFVFVSHLKTEETVRRAASLGIEHYFKKPFMLVELLGILGNLASKKEFL
ncbi:MAG: diguanylate cyclase [Clostridia bacterium]|nr:diguanylate cyclase [Clostridia bacterium]